MLPFPLGAVSMILIPPEYITKYKQIMNHRVADLKLGEYRNGFRFGKGLEKLLICLLVFKGGGGSSCWSLLTLLCLGDDRFVCGGNTWPRTGASVRNAYHDDACQLGTDPQQETPNIQLWVRKADRQPASAGRGLRNSPSLNSNH